MNDQNKNLVPAFVLSVLILVVWQYFFVGPQQEAERALKLQQQQIAAEQALTVEKTKAENEAPKAEIITRTEALSQGNRLEISGDSISGSINLNGAKFDDIVLNDYHVDLDDNSPKVDILDPMNTAKQYFAEFGWVDEKGRDLLDVNGLWQSSASSLRSGETVTLTRSQDGYLFEQEISLDKDYLFTVTQKVTNQTGTELNLRPFGLISRTGHPEISLGVVHQGPIGMLDEKLKELKYDDLKEENEVFSSTGGWLGITDKYWLVSLIPDQTEKLTARFNYLPKNNRFQVDFTADETVTVAPGETIEITNHLFTGAKELSVIEAYEDSLNVHRFNRTIDFGWYYFLTWPMYAALNFIASQTGSFAIALLVMTVILKAALFPLANKSYVSMSRMKKLTPKLNQIKEKFEGDHARIQKEVMALYSREKVNPLSGCLPILLQIPIFFSLYKVFSISIEMRHAPFWGWIEDMSAPDPTTIWNLFGFIPWDPTSFIPGILMFGAWPLMMAFTMYLQQKMNPAPTDPSQAMMMRIMPVMMLFILGGFAAGLVIYWTWSNILSILQQYIIMRRMGVSIIEDDEATEEKGKA